MFSVIYNFRYGHYIKTVILIKKSIVLPEIIENFHQISASIFLASHEINESDLICY